MRGLLPFFSIAFLACCHPAPPKPPSPPVPFDLGAGVDLAARVDLAGPPLALCVLTPDLTPDDVCPDLFTDDGVACIRCPGAQGCVDAIDHVYCVQSGCALDARCNVHRVVNPLGARRRRP